MADDSLVSVGSQDVLVWAAEKPAIIIAVPAPHIDLEISIVDAIDVKRLEDMARALTTGNPQTLSSVARGPCGGEGEADDVAAVQLQPSMCREIRWKAN